MTSQAIDKLFKKKPLKSEHKYKLDDMIENIDTYLLNADPNHKPWNEKDEKDQKAKKKEK